MLDKDQIEAAARLLHGHWRAGTKLGALEKVSVGLSSLRRPCQAKRRAGTTPNDARRSPSRRAHGWRRI